MKTKKRAILGFLCIYLCFYLTGCSAGNIQTGAAYDRSVTEASSFTVPAYSGEAYIVLNDNMPDFSEEEKGDRTPFETYSELDELGRCHTAYANICTELMPTGNRGEISHIKPTGWQSARYDFVDQESLYNRCHLIGYQLAGENDNEQNLITGTRYMNTEGMLPFENMVREYVDKTDNHVLYRVTPIFEENNLVASGVEMEAFSVEDAGEGICFHVYAYNVQPGVIIDYATGDNRLVSAQVTAFQEDITEKSDYVLNTNTQKFHSPTCSSVSEMQEHNKKEVLGTREEIISWGYEPCGRCRP